MKQFRTKVSGLVLIELPVVVASIGMLAMMLLPMLAKAEGPLGSDIITSEAYTNIYTTLTNASVAAASSNITATVILNGLIDTNGVANSPSTLVDYTIWPDLVNTTFVGGVSTVGGVTNSLLGLNGFPLYPGGGTGTTNFVTRRPALYNGLISLSYTFNVKTNLPAMIIIANKVIGRFHGTL